jgi:hypothetical protein
MRFLRAGRLRARRQPPVGSLRRPANRMSRVKKVTGDVVRAVYRAGLRLEDRPGRNIFRAYGVTYTEERA